MVAIMKRVKAACIRQTLHFMLKEGAEQEFAVKMVDEEVRRYKDQLERNKVKYRILSENKLEDGSVMMEIIKQYNNTPVGTYLD